MNLVSRLLLTVSKETISGKNHPNWPPLHARTIDLERDQGTQESSIVDCLFCLKPLNRRSVFNCLK